ncbi:CHAT domain-containing protein [Micromonospora rifamycinica]|uniref:CHAT domain-containing protein n=1 Tax=Micromonospora rifamycinica TaxID=291594 RepID=UPI0033F9C374
MGQPDRSPPDRQAAIVRIVAIGRAAVAGNVTDVPGALADLDQLAGEFADDRQVRALAEATASALGLLRGSPMLDPGRMRAALASLDELTEAVPGAAPAVEPTRALMPDLLRMAQAHRDGDTGTARALFAALRVRADELPPGDPLGGALADVAPLLDALYAGMDDTEAQLPDPGPEASETQRALHLMVRGGLAMRPDDAADPERVEAGLDDLRAVVASLPGHHPYRVMCLTSLGLGLARRAELRGTLADVDEAITVLEEARTLAGDATHPQWSFVNELLTMLLRRRGREPLARRAALEGLRGYAWQVLRQPEPAAARAAAREAVDVAVDIAGGCLSRHQPADALRALDAGRGLLLFATTAWRDPYTRLAEAGHRDLADEWRATEHPSPWLRERVLTALTQDTGLLDPPDLTEIQGALRRLAVDALVYLVPAIAPSPGWAVIAPVEGPARYLALSLLSIGAGTDVERYLTALAARDPREVGSMDQDVLTDRLDALCTWAWKAAMGPVVGPYLDAGRVPRLVLVPMGDLARVPWQAALAPDGTYLVQRVALSQAASARMLCDTATAERAPTARTGLVLADPDTGPRAGSLRSARLEAYGIHQVFYPGATYVGRRPDGSVSPSGAGTADDVRSWLRADGTPAGSLLHLASHGVMETAPATASSRLLLAGGDLTADELVEVMTGVDRRPVGLVVLAACHTGRSVHGYDEAYSLGTMFLAAGARSVLSTQWSIPDGETSLLMYMFHHYLVAERHPPGDALRRAQMWMLDGQRRPPRHMPPALRRMLDDTDPARVVAWAGFTHWGQ